MWRVVLPAANTTVAPEPQLLLLVRDTLFNVAPFGRVTVIVPVNLQLLFDVVIAPELIDHDTSPVVTLEPLLLEFKVYVAVSPHILPTPRVKRIVNKRYYLL